MFDFGYGRPRPRFTDAEKKALYTQQKGICNGCRRKLDIRDFQVDHKRSLARGGSDRFSNLQLLCANCNTTKGEGTMAELRTRLRAKGLVKGAAPKKPTGKKPGKKKPSRKKRQDPFDILRW